jgi:hypothetical protein
MQRYFVFLSATAAVSLSLLSAPGVNAMIAGTASGTRQGLAETSVVERVVRVCRHRFWTSRRECYVDRSRPPTVCHHIRSTSRRDCY